MAVAVSMLTFTMVHVEASWATPMCMLSVIALVGTFGIGLGPVPGLLPTELFPAAHRATGCGLCLSAMWLANFVTAQLFLWQGVCYS